ncbi:hypothetical protein QC763_124070 [Podospora pseudopauciseta]|uniref:NodB homology domain-containing protein n=1 Tax=Podospora pseudopauciseta TaxID=2093780 RepID=A0ABR0I3V1_9PEZI|nr:hypothetical protein QC763_124070 [Podospora pseudopauciseta]
MFFERWFAAGLAGILAASGVNAQACTSNLLIDNFTKWTSGVNNLESPNGDDGSMEFIAAGTGQVVFTPKDTTSYFYESFECQPAVTNGYGGLQFTVEGPAGASFALELQTTSSCSANDGTYKSHYTIIENLTGSRQTINVPLVGFDNEPNYDAVVGWVWAVFSQSNVQWSIGNITWICGNVAQPTSPGSTSVPTRSTIVPTATRSTIAPPVTTSQPATCFNLLIDDWASQSRLTFLGYNAMGQATSDDGTMSSVVVSNNRVLLYPKDANSYFYSQFGCLNANNRYGGISFRVRAARGTSFSVALGWSDSCGSTNVKTVSLTTAQLKWTFDGTEKLYSFPFSVFSGVDTTKLDMIYFSGLNAGIILGPMSFYCGSTATEYVAPASSPAPSALTRTTTQVATPSAKGYVIDTFSNENTNSLGEWHGPDEGMAVTFGNNAITIRTNDSDQSWNTQLANKCADLRNLTGGYLHIAYSGSNKFSIALQQHNSKCNETMAPYPETWDSVEASRYATTSDIYVPITHFSINLQRVIGFNLRGFYTSEPTTITKIEIVTSIPPNFKIPPKLASGRLVFACTRPNSFAFAIDDGNPEYIPQVMKILKEANIPLTFFTVGLPLLDQSNGLAAAYKDMASRGHQIALHSYTHPKMEGLATEQAIDWEIQNDIGAVRQVFPNLRSSYFRPPFGTEGARMRQRLAANLNDPEPYIVGWSIDVEDWLWAESSTPNKQLDAFKRDLAKGGNLMVMHYLHQSTVDLLPEFIKLAKASGKRLMRVDQCLEDPKAPALT